MFLDASAIVAILAKEPEEPTLLARLGQASKCYVSPIVIYEAALAIARIDSVSLDYARSIVERFLARIPAKIVPITARHGELAIAVFERYGKGRHPAALNMGDCFAYACAQDLDVPLLFKGDDFSKTDVLLP
jgi:ribonuclease VapC